jgi:protein-S-isoprenylcysteine O-methyltransferase Ste14
LLTFPLVWAGRYILDRQPTAIRASNLTPFVQTGVALTLGVPFVRAVITHHSWTGWILPVPPVVGLILVIITVAAAFLVVLNLALKGFGAPAIALSRKLAVDWFYARTRSPMVLASLSFFLSLGIWFRSALFIVWRSSWSPRHCFSL